MKKKAPNSGPNTVPAPPIMTIAMKIIEYKRLNEDKIDLALRMEKETGYYIPNGKYWKKMNEFDEKKIKEIDDLWLSSIEKI